MILIARAPVRISFGGGGTDLPAYYQRYGGLVVSTTINYYVYTILTADSEDAVQIISADYRALYQRATCEDLIWDGGLSLPKAITYYFWSGLDLDPAETAELACFIEIEKMGMPVGKQDQYAAAFGGLNCITFSEEEVTVEPLSVPAETRNRLEEGIMLFFTGTSRESSTILKRQRQASQTGEEETLRRLDAIKELGLEIRAALERADLDAFGELLHRSWVQKRGLTKGVTNPLIDQCYETARQHGALGGKVTGAGGGGFLMLYCPVEQQEAVTEALSDLGLQRRPFAFDREGVQVMQAVTWRPPRLSQPLFPGRMAVG